MLERVGQKLLAGAVPDGFKVHKRIARRLKDKEKMLQTGKVGAEMDKQGVCCFCVAFLGVCECSYEEMVYKREEGECEDNPIRGNRKFSLTSSDFPL